MRSNQSKLPNIARILLGLAFFVFGLNGFLGFLPQPPPPEAAGALMGAMVSSGYLMALVKGTEVVAGALLLSGRYVPLALTVLAPVLVNILAFHLFLAPSGIAVGAVLAGLTIYVAWAYRDAFRPMLQSDAKPRAAALSASRREALAG